MNPYSCNDPTNKTSLKVKVMTQKNGTINILFEVLHLKADNMTQMYKVDYFMDIEDFDYLSQLYRTKQIHSDNQFLRSKGYNGNVRIINFLVRYEKQTPGHLSISISNGTGTALKNGYTPKMETCTNKRMINISYEQSIKMFKYIERIVMAHTFLAVQRQINDNRKEQNESN